MIEAKKNTFELAKGWSYKYGIPFDSSNYQDVNHERLSEIILSKECEVASVLVVMDHLDESHLRDPKYMRVSTQLGASDIEVEARKRLINQYPSMDEVREMAREWGLDQPVNNYNKGKTIEELNRERESKVTDLIFQACNYALYPEILAEFELDFKETWKEEKKSGDWRTAWEKEKIRLLSPCVLNEYDRVYNLPEPMLHWDTRNPWAQVYFVGHQGEVGWVQGGSAGSHQREVHGRWGHTFAALARRGIESPTYVYRHTAHNEFILEKVYEKFRAHSSDLTGNYRASWSETKELFLHRLLSTSGGVIKEVRQ